ncbi:MAG: hypothetical protein IJ693_11760 [Bacteroidaceae bacterium]|nr:hypothetical protein [Bacteroidaceae bacterium]
MKVPNIVGVSFISGTIIREQCTVVPSRQLIYVPSTARLTPLCTVGLAALDHTDTVQNGERIHTIKLTATLRERVAVPSGSSVVATTASGFSYVIGGGQRPFPLVTQQDHRADRPGERSAVTLTVELTSSTPLLAVVEA